MLVSLLMIVLFGWLFFKSLGFFFRLTWGLAKIVGTLLMVLALPVLGVCLLFAGGVMLIVPVAIMAVAFAVLNAC